MSLQQVPNNIKRSRVTNQNYKPLAQKPISTPLLQNKMPCQETSDFNSKLLVEHGMNNLVVPSLNTQTTRLNTHPANEINKVYIELDDYRNDDTEVYFHKENMNVGNLEIQSKSVRLKSFKSYITFIFIYFIYILFFNLIIKY